MFAPSSSRPWWALGALTVAVLAVSLDATVLSVALPTLAVALHASETQLQWVQSGYLLALAASILPAGLIGDRVGRRAVLIASLVAGSGAVLAITFLPEAPTGGRSPSQHPEQPSKPERLEGGVSR